MKPFARLPLASATLAALMLVTCPASARADDLKRRGMIGVQLLPLTEESRTQFKIAVEKGVVFSGIVPGSPAEKGGLKQWDICTRVGDQTVESLPGFMKLMRKFGAGDTVKFTVVREGSETAAEVTLNPRPLETSTDYDIVYDAAGEPGKRVRMILTKPKDAAKHPAVMFIQGMGPGPVEFLSPAMTPFRNIINELTKAGVVTLRVERVGVGDSEGADVHENTIDTDVASFRAALTKLSKYDYVDPNKVFVFAHSSGAALAPAVAKDLPIKGIATFAAFARPWSEHSMDASMRQWKLELKSEDEIKALVEKERLFDGEFFGKKKSPKDIVAAHPELKEYAAEFVEDDTFIFGLHYRYMQELGALDLASAWGKIKVPVLALWGEADFSASKTDSELIASIINKNAPGKGKFTALPKTDHAYSQAEDQEESFLSGRTGGTFNPVVIDTLMKWLTENAG